MIVATAGHIDHGKTALVKALTGVDADRLPEEKSRGITIDLGFAYRRAADGASLGFVDVPGHERLVRTMLAGAIGVDFALLVVAADDGPMPQTREHLAILDLLGLSRGAVALTKIDRVAPARVGEVETAIRAMLDDTVLRHAPVFPCSALAGAGIAELARHLDEAARRPGERHEGGHFRLAVDRVFTLPGIGLIVTGTVHAGKVAVGDRLVLSPAGTAARVRGLRRQNEAAQAGAAGERLALNLVGPRLDKHAIHRGHWILAPDLHAPTTRMDVRLRLLPQEARALRHWTPVHVHLGAADINGRVSLLEDKLLERGESALAQLVLDAPVGALNGDRFVIRDQSAQRTLGGGRVIDPFPPKRGARKPERLATLAAANREAAGEALEALLDEAPFGLDLDRFRLARNLTEAETAALLRASPIVEVTAGRARLGVSRVRWEALAARLLAALAAYQEEHPDSPGATADDLIRRFEVPARAAAGAALRGLVEDRTVLRYGLLLHLPGHTVKLSLDDENLWEEIRAVLASAGIDQPRLAVLAERLRLTEAEIMPLLQKLGRIGRLRRVSQQYFMLPDVLAALAADAQRLAEASPAGLLTVGRFREATGVTRHMTMPVLEFFDKVGLTSRVKDGRVIRHDWREIFTPETGLETDETASCSAN